MGFGNKGSGAMGVIWGLVIGVMGSWRLYGGNGVMGAL